MGAESSNARISPFSLLNNKPPRVAISIVTTEESYNYFGTLTQELLVNEASNFVVKHSDTDLTSISLTLNSFIQFTLDDYLESKKLKEIPQDLATWLFIRITTPSEEYTDMPRWHRDGRMFHSEVEGAINSKYAITLLGNLTKVLAESDVVRKVVTGNHSRRRGEYARLLAGEMPLAVESGEIIRFTWGQKDSPVHSEPGCNSDRVFVSILFGADGELRDMCRIRERKMSEMGKKSD